MKGLFFILLLFIYQQISAQNIILIPTSKTNQIIEHKYFTLSYSEKNEQAEWVFYLLTKANISGTVERGNNFRPDPLVETGSASLIDYKNSEYDRGHLCPAADMSFDAEAMSETFYFSNMSPQNPSFNRGIWKSLEDLVRRWAAEEDSIYIVTGPIFIDNRGSIGKDSVTIPGFFYKVVYDPTGEKKMIGFIMPNEKGVSKILSDYVFSIDEIEEITKTDFFYNLPDSLEFNLEKKIDLRLWKF